MQVTSSGAAAVWDTPTIEPIIPSSVDAYDPGNPDNGGTLDSPPQQQDSSAGYDTVETKPLLQGPAPGFEIRYTKPLLVDPATGEALELVHTKPLQIGQDSSGPVDYGVNKPLQIDGAQGVEIAYTKPLLIDPATGEAAELVHTKPLQITPEPAAQVASPDAATAVAAPKASTMEIAALELLLAEPANQEMIAQFGPPLAPLNTGTDVGSGIQARFGADLGARLTQLQEAQDGVRNEFLRALDDASQNPGPDVPGSTLVPVSGQGENEVPEHWTFDPAVFAQHYAQGDSLAQRAFADMHGKDPLEFHAARDISDSHTDPSFYTLGSFRLTQESKPSQELLLQHGSNETNDQNSVLSYTLHKGYGQLDPQNNANLINKEYLWFDPVNGWSTHGDNIQDKQSFLDKAMPTLFGAALCFIGLPPVGNFLAQAGAGTFVQGAAMGALSSSITQLASTGELNFGSMLRSALTGGVASSVMDISGMGDMLKSTDLGTRSLANFGKASLQGALQEATGGKFKDGFINSALSSVAGEVGAHLDNQILELKNLSPEQSSALKLMSRAATSALRVASSNDPASGFANDFLSGVLEEQYQKASKPTSGEKPNNEWVQSLGASDVGPAQAQGLQPGRSSQGMRVSGDVLSNWSDEIDGGITLNGSMAPEAPAINEAVVGKGQGPLAAMAAAGLSAQEQTAAYGQLLSSGQVRLNAQGVPMVQPGQVLRFDLSDTSAAQLGGRAIAAESWGRAQREAQAAQQTAETYAGAGGGRGFVNPAPASEYGNYPFAGRSTVTDPSAYTDPRQRVMTLASMSDMPVESFSAAEWRAAASEYKQIQGKDFSRDSIYNGLWTKATVLENAAGKGFSRDAINDITGFATEEGLHAQVGMAMGGALGRGIGNRLGGSVDNVAGPAGGAPNGNSGVSGVEAASSRGISNNGGVELAEGASSLIGANRAVIDPRKLTDYALNPAHPVGGNKARVFESALGFTKSNADDLMSQLRQGVMNYTPIAGKVDQFGSRFTVDIPVTGPAGSGVVRSGWIYKPGSSVPEMTTIFVK